MLISGVLFLGFQEGRLRLGEGEGLVRGLQGLESGPHNTLSRSGSQLHSEAHTMKRFAELLPWPPPVASTHMRGGLLRPHGVNHPLQAHTLSHLPLLHAQFPLPAELSCTSPAVLYLSSFSSQLCLPWPGNPSSAQGRVGILSLITPLPWFAPTASLGCVLGFFLSTPCTQASGPQPV